MSTLVSLEIDRDRGAPRAARSAIDALGGRVDPALVPDAKLLASEIVTNAVKYGHDGVVRLVVAEPAPGRVRVEVADSGTGFVPARRSGPRTDVGGWGLHLVDALAERWGVGEGRACVWFELSAA